MTQHQLSTEYEEMLKGDCAKLFAVLKNCENPSEDKNEESLKILYRIVFLISYRQSSKMMAITAFTVRHLCHHPMLPIILIEILKESKNIKVCACVLEILAKMIIKNPSIPENDRKTCRRAFSEPINFKSALDAFQRVYAHFLQEKTNSLFYEIQLRLLKIINCLYVRKGQAQISTLNEQTVVFIGRHLTKYKMHKDISTNILPLIKTLCRNKKYSTLLCDENFLSSLTTVVPSSNKYQVAITILKLLSRSPEAVQEMSRSEKTFHFVLTTANNHAERPANKKYLMTTLYRLTKTDAGAENIAKSYLWLLLLEFFIKLDHVEDFKQRMAAVKAYTILHRGVPTKMISINKVNIDFGFSDAILDYKNSNHHSDDSDNEESEDEEEGKQQGIARTSSEENDDSDESEIESDNEEVDSDEKPPEPKIRKENVDYMKPYYKEFFPDENPPKLSVLQVNRHKLINRQAFPDAILAESDRNDNLFITSSVNCFSSEDLSHKIKSLKGINEESFKRRIVFDLDKLIENNEDQIDVPELEMFRQVDLEYVHNKNPCLVKQNSWRSIKCKRGPPTLQFESRFECGNLRKVEQVGDCEYNLFLSSDINMTNGLQWFYFQVTSMLPGETYTFSIVNFQKANSQFNYGLQPVMFSITDYLMHATGWRKVGEKIIYFGNELVNKDSEKQFRTLSFNITFPHGNDYCYFAYHFPYSYKRLMETLLPFASITDNIYSRLDKLTDTVNGFNEVPLLTITANSDLIEKRPLVFLTARVHPGESNSSWIMDGILQFLLDQQDERAINARGHYIFKIIPMLNPEGVIYGNTRCGLTGNDLNRCWKKPHPVLHPEIYYAKKLVQFAKEQLDHPIFTFIDIHGHSRKKFFFLYGCNPKQSWNDIDKSMADSSDVSYNLLPKALSVNENMKMSFCRYTIERKREATCRVVMWREFGIKCSYTLECSFCSGENKKKITTKMLRDIGISVITSLASIADTV